MPSTTMTWIGAVLQGAGLACVFWEVISIRLDFWGVPVWWTLTSRWVRRRLLRRDVNVTVSGAAALGFTGSLGVAKGTVTPGENATDAERVAWLMTQVEQLNAELSQVHKSLKSEVAAALAKAEEGDQALRTLIEADKQLDRARLRRSLIRQTVGAALVGVGLVVGTIGAVN